MSNELTVPGPDPFKEYVQAYDANSMGMKRIKFSKGFWNKIDIGSDPVEIKRGTRVISPTKPLCPASPLRSMENGEEWPFDKSYLPQVPAC